MLSVLPQRILDESLASYLLRITLRNGFTSPMDWLNKPLWNAVTKNKFSMKQRMRLNELVPGVLSARESNLSIRHSVLFPDCHTDTPRICPHCVTDTGYLKDKWRNIGNLSCELHGCALVDSCQECGEQLSWSPLLLEGICTNELCCYRIQSSPIPDQISELFIDEICDCLLADLFVQNPYTTVLPTYHNPSINKFPIMLEQGFHLLTNRVIYDEFVEQLAGSFSPFSGLSAIYQFFPLALLNHHLSGTWPINDWYVSLPKTQQRSCNPKVKVESFIVTFESASNLLGITKEQLFNVFPKLVSKKFIPKNQQFDIAAIIK